MFDEEHVLNFGLTATREPCILFNQMNLFPNEQNFDLDKSRQKFHHRLKEHHKISKYSETSLRNVVKCG
jgi:hypothetical protein